MTKRPLSYRAFCLCAMIILLLSLLWGFYWGTQKRGMYVDEYFSYTLANNQSGQHADITTDAWIDSSEILPSLVVSPEEAFDYQRVYINQAKDVHPPLYYHLLHTICSFFPNQFSPWFAISINFFFYAAGFIVLACLLLQLAPSPVNRPVILLALAVFATNASTVSMLLFARMYMMLTFFVLVLAWLHTLVISQKLRFHVFLILTAVTCFLGFLTQYFFLIFAGVLSALFSVYLLAKKPYGPKSARAFAMYAATLLVTLGCTYLAFPPWVEHVFDGYRGEEALSFLSSNSNFLAKEQYYYGILSDTLFSGALTWLLALMLLLGVSLLVVRIVTHRTQKGALPFAKPKAPQASLLIIVGATCLFLPITAQMGLMGESVDHVQFRYLYPVYPLFLVFTVLALDRLFALLFKRRILAALLTLVLFSGINGLGYHRSYNAALSTVTNEPLFVYSGEEEHLAFAAQHHDTPVIILYRGRGFYHNIFSELMQYDQLLFMHALHFEISEENILAVEDCQELIVYLPYGDEEEDSYLGFILETFPWLYGADWQYDTIGSGYSVYLFEM